MTSFKIVGLVWLLFAHDSHHPYQEEIYVFTSEAACEKALAEKKVGHCEWAQTLSLPEEKEKPK